MNDQIILLLLIVAHIIGDFYGQSRKQVEHKALHHGASAWVAHLQHALIHAGLLYGLLWLPSISAAERLWTVGILALSHLLIDLLKSTYSHYYPERNPLAAFIIDQLAHLVVILLVWFALFDNLSLAMQQLSSQHLVYAIAYLLILKPTSVFVSVVLEQCNIKPESKAANDKQIPKAGTAIGYLERAVILTLIFAGQYTAIGFVIAAKSVLRFGENKQADTQLNEYVLLGTLASFAAVLFVGVAAEWAVR